METANDKYEKYLTIRINVFACRNIIVDKIPSHVWRDAKAQVEKLLDQSVTQQEKERIAAELTQMFQRMEEKSILETNIPRDVDVRVNLNADDVEETRSKSKFNHKLKDKITEFNEGLSTLGEGISRLKTKLLTLEYQRPDPNHVDVQMCRNIHRNFRRILQKESRFLRDELLAAKDTIYRLERKPCSVKSESIDQNMKMVPYSDFQYHPVNFINVETASHIWNPPQYGTYPVPERLYYDPELMTPVLPSYEQYAAERDAIPRESVCCNAIVPRPLQKLVPSQSNQTDTESKYEETYSVSGN